MRLGISLKTLAASTSALMILSCVQGPAKSQAQTSNNPPDLRKQQPLTNTNNANTDNPIGMRVLSENLEELRCNFQCSAVVPRTVLMDVSWPVNGPAGFMASTKSLSVASEHDGFETGSFGDIKLDQIDKSFGLDGKSTRVTDPEYLKESRGQTLTIRNKGQIIQNSRSRTEKVLGLGQQKQIDAPNTSAPLNYSTSLLARLRVVGSAFDQKSTVPRGIVSFSGVEANTVYRFRLSDGADVISERICPAPVCVADYVTGSQAGPIQ